MSPLRVAVEGIGLWHAQLADFAGLRALLGGNPPAPPAPRPAAAILPPNERRRAPESVLLAVEVAGQAVAMSGRAAESLISIFTSSHGDQSITDYMCATLATAAAELSPTRFHNSVHNAPAGYWTIATGCHAASTAVCAHHASFGAGLLEAVTLLASEQQPVLLVCSDTAGSGPLREVTGCTQAFGCALVLAPPSTRRAMATLELSLASVPHVPPALPAPLSDWRAGNPAAAALDMLTAWVNHAPRATVAATPHRALDISMEYHD